MSTLVLLSGVSALFIIAASLRGLALWHYRATRLHKPSKLPGLGERA